MTIVMIIAGVLAVGLLTYLFYALFASNKH